MNLELDERQKEERDPTNDLPMETDKKQMSSVYPQKKEWMTTVFFI